LTNLAADTQVATTSELPKLRERLAWIDRRLEQTQRDCGEDWRQTGEVLAAHGLACAELGLYADAVRDLDAAMASEAPGISRDLIEHRTRCQSRIAFALHEAGDSAAALQQFDDLLAALGAGQDPTPSLARVDTLSGIYWRRLQVLGRTERKAALETILKLYDAAVAARPKVAADPLGSYTRLLWLSARYLLTAYSKREVDEVCPDFDAWCDRMKENAEADDWGGLRADVTQIEVDLLHLIRHRERLQAEANAQGSVKDPVEAEQQALAERLAAALGRGLSARQWSGLDNHLRQLETLLAQATVRPVERGKDAAIAAALHERLLRG
jgi:tetratricopeptide (TPR) repeat protein